MTRTFTRSFIASTLSFAALVSAQAAQAQQAQQACITTADASDTAIYLMPIAYEGALKSCRSEFSDNAFMPSAEGKTYIKNFRKKQDEAWPGAYRALQVLVAGQGGDAGGDNAAIAQTFGQLSPEQLRPFADAFIGQIVAEEIKPDSCDKIDRGVELLSPLPAENVGGLISFVLELVDAGGDLPICNADGTVRVRPEAGQDAGPDAAPADEAGGQ